MLGWIRLGKNFRGGWIGLRFKMDPRPSLGDRPMKTRWRMVYYGKRRRCRLRSKNYDSSCPRDAAGAQLFTRRRARSYLLPYLISSDLIPTDRISSELFVAFTAANRVALQHTTQFAVAATNLSWRT